ncbi:hypothetical protein BDV95DRAFT_319814 [Massariosphaeria phaeospora]|uniref:Uncharacterized protein n=1 Tax=Massariosphaeria phaeospora TaxID=100035 RepID=A0A7C8ID23_9PLEO|nr:hypothetical protein BDV95DRAFT_319814 [Massariosphaeria phaeospora]
MQKRASRALSPPSAPEVSDAAHSTAAAPPQGILRPTLALLPLPSQVSSVVTCEGPVSTVSGSCCHGQQPSTMLVAPPRSRSWSEPAGWRPWAPLLSRKAGTSSRIRRRAHSRAFYAQSERALRVGMTDHLRLYPAGIFGRLGGWVADSAISGGGGQRQLRCQPLSTLQPWDQMAYFQASPHRNASIGSIHLPRGCRGASIVAVGLTRRPTS